MRKLTPEEAAARMQLEMDRLREIGPRAGVRMPMRGLGDVIEMIAKPIAKVLKLPCLDGDDQLKPDSGCAKRRDAANRTVPFGGSEGKPGA